MTLFGLVLASLRTHRRAAIGIALGSGIATAVLIGALVVGDAVRASLRAMSAARTGAVRYRLASEELDFRQALADELAADLDLGATPVYRTPGVLSARGGARRAGGVVVYGVRPAFSELSVTGEPAPIHSGEVLFSEALARRLQLAPGDDVVLRFESADALPGEVPFVSADRGRSLVLRYAGTLPDTALGRFAEMPSQRPPLNAFVPLDALTQGLERPGRANLILFGGDAGHGDSSGDLEPRISAGLAKHLQATDLGLTLRDAGAELELVSRRIFLQDALVEQASKAGQEPRRVLSYFVNSLEAGEGKTARATPYSIVSAIDGRPELTPKRGQILLTDWLAEDLAAKPGDPITLRWFATAGSRRLKERSGTLTAGHTISADKLDPGLMPPFPGMADKESCRDWDSSLPIKLDRVRDKDEAWWKARQGTPKALIHPEDARELWKNRYGSTTALRFPKSQNSREAIAAKLPAVVDPKAAGLSLAGLAGAGTGPSQTVDFGGLFLGLSMFLIASALILCAMMFQFALETRASELGTLLALGWSRSRVRALVRREGLALAIAGALPGLVLGLGFAAALIAFLRGAWNTIIGTAEIPFHASPTTLVIGLTAGVIVSALTLARAFRRLMERRLPELLAGVTEPTVSELKDDRQPWRVRELLLSGLPLLTALAVVVPATPGLRTPAWFGAGALVLAALVGAVRRALRRAARSCNAASVLSSKGELARRALLRRPDRSSATVTILALATFLIVAIGAWRHDPTAGADKPGSGTGGYAVYAESTLPISADLEDPEQRDELGLGSPGLKAVTLLGLRVRDGGDASCLNLNRVGRPTILGVPTERFKDRGAFRILGTSSGEAVWTRLEQPEPDGAIPVFLDQNTALWALGMSLGSTLEIKDGEGRARTLRLVGWLATSIFQGRLLMSESRFRELFPLEDGARVFLVEESGESSGERAPEAARQLSDRLNRALVDQGFEARPAVERLASFLAVENTYLAIFQSLGGLALLLGSLGLGLVVARNVSDRRGELAVLRAVGFRRVELRKLIVLEHVQLLGLGLGCGLLPAALAIVPALQSHAGSGPFKAIAGLLGLVLINGLVMVRFSADRALSGDTLDALSEE